MLSQNEKAILRYLINNRGKDSYVTSKDLAQHLSRTDRSVRTYLKELMTSLCDDSGFEIIAKQGFGYKINILDDKRYHKFVKAQKLIDHQNSEDINNRHNYILNKLIFEQVSLFFDDLVEELYVSRSTLSADFRKIRELLAPYQITVESRANKGVYVEGEEKDKRRFIMDYFFSGQYLKNMHHYIADDILDVPISFEELTLIVLDECRNQGLKLSDFVIQNLVIHIALAIKRFTAGFAISPIDVDQAKFHNELLVASSILNRLRLLTGLDFPDQEGNYIALHLISKARFEERVRDDGANQQLRQELLSGLTLLSESTGYDFADDFALVEGLLSHLAILLERIQNKIRLTNPLLEDIRGQYANVFELTKILMASLPLFEGYEVSEDELAYISLHLLAAIERFKEKHKLNALVICATGYGSAQMLKHRIKNELGQYLQVVDLVGYYDLDDEKLKDIDVIISSIDLSNLVFNIPVFTVSVFLKEEEVKEIKNALTALSRRITSCLQPEIINDMSVIFDNYFSKERFNIYQSVTKETLLQELATKLMTSEVKRDKFLYLIKQRESMSTVIFNDVIAVPHPIKALATDHKIGVAIVKEGVAWETGYESIKLIFLVSPSIYDNEGLSDITTRIVDLVDQPEKVAQLLEADSLEAFKAIFLS